MKSAPHEFVHGKTFWLSCAVCGMERNATPLHNKPPLNPDALEPEVTSVEELDALPPESYVQGWDGFKHAKTHSGEWVLCVEHTRGAHDSGSIELPARVLYRGVES